MHVVEISLIKLSLTMNLLHNVARSIPWNEAHRGQDVLSLIHTLNLELRLQKSEGSCSRRVPCLSQEASSLRVDEPLNAKDGRFIARDPHFFVCLFRSRHARDVS